MKNLQAFVGLERVRIDVNASTLPQPLLLHKKSIFVVDGGSGADDFHPCDPLPGAWVNISRSEKIETKRRPAGIV